MSGLELLMKAPEKAFVEQIFVLSFSGRKRGNVPDLMLEKTSSSMDITKEEAAKMFSDVIKLINKIVFENVTTSSELKGMLPSSLNDKLKSLIVSVVGKNLVSWREIVGNDQLSLPRLTEFDWRVDVKTSSNTLSSVSIPTALISMTVEGQSSTLSHVPQAEHIYFEATKHTLETMLDGLGKIRDQLASVATQQEE
eukprot:m.9797 g.9797  ORF g.9797 m.9797 type:complete len:196 (+) comp3558_c0_seq1:40-627(+)